MRANWSIRKPKLNLVNGVASKMNITATSITEATYSLYGPPGTGI